MKERPILFSAPMVRALLAGTKTQTRRIVKNTTKTCAPCFDAGVPHNNGDGGAGVFGSDAYLRVAYCDHTTYSGGRIRCPYGVPGDRLWARETWAPSAGHRDGKCDGNCATVLVKYQADGGWKEFAASEVPAEWEWPKAARGGRNVSPLFLPRWASRITLEVTGVRVQRVQDISEEDARAEGMNLAGEDPRASYETLWDHINGAGSWESNPWVWAVTFAVLGSGSEMSVKLAEGRV